MYDVTWVDIDGIESMIRYDADQEKEAMGRYEELIQSGKCTWVQIVKLINNWSIDD